MDEQEEGRVVEINEAERKDKGVRRPIEGGNKDITIVIIQWAFS
jgi:hypothetical protein